MQVAPKSTTTWETWIALEEELGRLDAANELRIRRDEQQWEFVIPPTFSTRPAEGSSPLATIAATLQRFFSLRGQVAGSAAEGTAGEPGTELGEGDSPTSRPLHELLPEDFRVDLSLEEILQAPGLGGSVPQATPSPALGDEPMPAAAAAAERPQGRGGAQARALAEASEAVAQRRRAQLRRSAARPQLPPQPRMLYADPGLRLAVPVEETPQAVEQSPEEDVVEWRPLVQAAVGAGPGPDATGGMLPPRNSSASRTAPKALLLRTAYTGEE